MKVGVKLSIPLNNLSKTREERSGEKERKTKKGTELGEGGGGVNGISPGSKGVCG